MVGAEQPWTATSVERLRAFPSVIDVIRLDDAVNANQLLLAAIDKLQDEGQHLDDRFASDDRPKWLSKTDLHSRESFVKLANVVEAACARRLRDAGYQFDEVRVTEAWAATCRSDAPPDQFHSHHNSYLSCVYYVSVPEGSGPITFQDPRFGAGGFRLARSAESQQSDQGDRLLEREMVTLAPEPGLLFLFPSWLRHRIERCNIPSGARRVSIAFNTMPTGFLGVPTGGLEFV